MKFAIAVFLTLSWGVSAMAQGAGQIRIINSSGAPLSDVTVVPCGGGEGVGLDAGEVVDVYDVRFFEVSGGCYDLLISINVGGRIVEKFEQVTVPAGVQVDVPVM